MKVRAGVSLTVLLLVIVPAGSLAQPPNDPTDLDADGLPGVAEPIPGTETPEVYALQGTGSILVDRSHYETFNINGFMWFLISQGWTVAENHDYPITEEILTPYDVVIIPSPATFLYPFSADEVAAFEAYLASGGGLWVLQDAQMWTPGINSLTSAFGVSFFEDTVIDTTDNEGAAIWPRISDLQTHAITTGVTSYGYYYGCCLAVTAPAIMIAAGDADAYSVNCPAAPPVLAAYESSGRIVFAGDITPLHPNYYPDRLKPEEELLLQNIIGWLAGMPPVANTPTSWGAIKAQFAD